VIKRGARWGIVAIEASGGDDASGMPAHQTLPVLVLLPGLDGTGKLFAEFVRALEPTVECVIVAYPKDQPMGYGELEGLVASACPKDRAFVLLGESFSGPLAIRIAARSPAGLVGLILSASFARNPYPTLGWARSLAAYLPVKHFPRWLRAPLMWGSVSPSAATSQSERAMTDVSAEVIRLRIAELLAVDETAALRQIHIPTLVLRAARDRVISRRATQVILKNCPGAKLVEVDAPHLLLQTQAAECGAVVVNFLKALN
jgi:pimeloyl-[acyl-carrier protein] methyl ester esterase